MLLLPSTVQRGGLTYIHRGLIPAFTGRGQSRNVSLTSAIEGGLRQDGKAFRQAERALRRAQVQRVEDGRLTRRELDDPGNIEAVRNARVRRREARDRISFLSEPSESASAATFQRSELDKRVRARARAQGIDLNPPAAVPYSHAASEFVYGTWSVLSALTANRRDFYKLYMYCGENGDSNESDAETTEIVRLAKAHKLDIRRVAGAWDKMLLKMTKSRPHNGVVLESSTLPVPHVTALLPVQNSPTFEMKKTSNTPNLSLPRTSKDRMPLLLWLDQIKDVGNMGAILRSAYYFGVDAVLLPSHNTAPLNSITIKTSAGCAEHIPIFMVDNEVDFMHQSQQNGWIFYAAAAAESKGNAFPQNSKPQTESVKPDSVLKMSPAVLMMGNEEFGLRAHLISKAQYPATIAAGRDNPFVDSLNVSVATALLVQQFLGKYNLKK